MTLPTFVSVGTAATGTTSLSVAYPSSPQADDIILLWVTTYDAGGSPSISTVTGFTAESQVTETYLARQAARLFWKRSTGSESGSVSVTTTGGDSSLGRMALFRGCTTSGTPYEDYDTTVVTGTGITSMTTASTTTTGTDRLLVRYYTSEEAGGKSPPSGWTERAESVGTGSYPEIYIDTKDLASSGTEAACARDVSDGSSWVTIAIALKPAGLTDYTMTAAKADLTAGGQDVTFKRGLLVGAANATLSASGQNVTLTATHLPLTAGKADLTIGGQDVTLNKGFTIAAAKADLTIGGQDVTLTAIRTMPADKIDLTLTGQDVNLLHGYLVSAEAGTLTLGGQDVSFLFNHLVAADASTLTLSGQVVLLTRTYLPLDAGYAELTLSGQDVTLAKGRLITVEAGTLTIGGQTVSFIGPRRFDIGEVIAMTGYADGYVMIGYADGYTMTGRP